LSSRVSAGHANEIPGWPVHPSCLSRCRRVAADPAPLAPAENARRTGTVA